MSSEEHQILKFRPRTLAKPPRALRNSRVDDNCSKGTEDPLRYERDRTWHDDYRHRMTANVAAILFTALLTGIGIWLAVKLADLRNAQDCVLMGRRDCAHISLLRG